MSHPYEAVLLSTNELTNVSYYEDPGTRRQLHRYLSSARKLDKTLDFGFSSTYRAKGSLCSTELSSAVQREPSYDAMDADDASLSSYGPSTPTADLDHGHPIVVEPTSSEADFGLPHQIHMPDKNADSDGNRNSRSSSRPDGDREVTRRMTVTHRKPRLLENKIYSWQSAQLSGERQTLGDPLALESLNVCDDASGQQGAFAVRDHGCDKGLRRAWASLRRR